MDPLTSRTMSLGGSSGHPHSHHDDEDDAHSFMSLSSSSTFSHDDDDANFDGRNAGEQIANAVSRDMTKLEQEANDQTKGETRALCCARSGLIVVMLLLTTIVAFVTYYILKQEQDVLLETNWDDTATHVTNLMQARAQDTLTTLNGLAIALASHGGSGEAWPNVTLPSFRAQALETETLTQAKAIQVWPVVAYQEIEEWMAYASAHLEDWLDPKLDLSQVSDSVFNFTYSRLTQETTKTDIDASNTNGSASYYPLWQSEPTLPSQLHWNALSYPELERLISRLDDPQVAVWGRTLDASNDPILQEWMQAWTSTQEDLKSEPLAIVTLPVRSSLDSSSTTVAAALTSILYWKDLLLQVADNEQTLPYTLVLDNGKDCAQTLSYSVSGREVQFLDYQDLHNSEWNRFGVSVPLFVSNNDDSSKNTGQVTLADYCPYTLSVYPTNDFVAYYHDDNKPAVYASVIAILLLGICVLLLIYDKTVERRQTEVLQDAIKADRIVSSLFPQQIKEKLYQQTLNENGNGNRKSVMEEIVPDEVLQAAAGGTPNQLKEDEENDDDDKIVTQTDFLADHFEDCTLFFFKIVGFTAWSSQREPAEIFTLLQTIFGCFDALANKLGVYQVETVGEQVSDAVYCCHSFIHSFFQSLTHTCVLLCT